MEINANTFLVSGGASGLGGATSTLLAKSGANVVIADINKDKGEALAAELGANTRFVECNVTDEDSVKAAVAAAVSNFGKLNGAINCACWDRSLSCNKKPVRSTKPKRIYAV